MKKVKSLRLVLCWHLHQPDYRNALTRSFELPWTYLHALKDYTDMAWHLERHPGMACVVNLVPSLVDQLDDYATQFEQRVFRDPLLDLLAMGSLCNLTPDQKRLVLGSCFRCNAVKMIDPFPGFRRLRDTHTLLTAAAEDHTDYLSTQYFADLLMWYHLAWTGESIRRQHPQVGRWLTQGERFTDQDRADLVTLMGEIMGGLLPRYRALNKTGRVELSTTPLTHPILPLLLDFNTAREAVPEMPLPQASHYPGGLERAVWQVEQGIAHHRRHFGALPKGIWPGEGALSTQTLSILAQNGCHWTASSETILANTRHRAALPPGDRATWLYRPHRFESKGKSLWCFFRDDVLSDRIGFEYSRWDSVDAARDFVRQLEAIHHQHQGADDPVVTVILDGENAWEYYPYNGYYFLDALYQELTQHPFIVTESFARCAQWATSRPLANLPPLKEVVAGSWVYGTLSTWMGDPAKNAAWDLLVEVKTAYDLALANNPQWGAKQRRRALDQLAICEGSDWFWWFGDYNSADSVQSFDHLYRLNLANLYQILELPVPQTVLRPLSAGSQSQDAGGTMRRNTSPETP